MKKSNILTTVLIAIFLISCSNLFAQAPKRDKAKLIEYKNEFWEKIEKTAKEFATPKKEIHKKFKMDYKGYDLPKSTKEFKQYWHNPPISQGWTGTCWDFSTTSFLESEAYRINGEKLKFSEIYTAYWEYVEKARRFVKERGNSAFAEGSESNAVMRIWAKYGCVPEKDYTGLKPNQKFHDHHKMISDMMDYLKSVKRDNAWNELVVLSTIKSIMNNYLGVPPSTITVDGKKMTPMEYLKNVVKINPDDYVEILSLMEKPYYKKVEYVVPDNWWHSKEYYNVPLDVYMKVLKNAIKNGYTLAIGGDVSETGYNSHYDVAMVPSYDIPAQYIDEYARQFRFSNKTTTDDHGIHVVGYKVDKDGKYWFLIKDSGSGSRNGKNKGYYFYDENYVKLKMVNFSVHKSAVKDLLKKFK